MKMNEDLLSQLKNTYRVTENDLGEDAKLSAKGMTFRLRTFEAEGLGHVCLLSMSGMLGLMQMQTFVLSPETIDLPLLNMDRISVLTRKTQMVEFYRMLLSPEADNNSAEYQWIKNKDAELKDYESGAHWYDSLLAPYSYAKVSNGFSTKRFDRACSEYMREFIRRCRIEEPCDKEAKMEKTRAFAQQLIDEGGPAVSQFRKLFGDEVQNTAEALYNYGRTDAAERSFQKLPDHKLIE